ncbi:MAG: WbqC family protein [Chitinophagales bacterium]
MIVENRTLLIETQYAGNLHYYARMLHHGKVQIEQYEHFQKASYRNRCYIAMPDGPLRLSVPVVKGRAKRRIVKEMKISYDWEWQRHHWNSFMSAYRSSPYFEYFEDDLRPLYEKKMDYLIDFNLQLDDFVITAINAQDDIQIERTPKFQKTPNSETTFDFRSAILPSTSRSKPDSLFTHPVYHQVFESKTGFVPNMSILDLLFAEGPKSLLILKNAMKTEKTES